MLIHRLIARSPYCRPADDGGTGGGGADRGDDFQSTEDVKADDAAKDDVITDEDKAKVGLRDEPEDDKDEDDKGDDDKDEDDEPKDEKKAKKDTRIPLKRHQELLQKERERREALERELASNRRTEQVQATNERVTELEDKLIKAESEYNKLVIDGEVEKATAKMREIRTLDREINSLRTDFAAQAAEARAYERARYDTTLERIESAYPQLNPDHDDFDKATLGEVAELVQGYVATGKYDRSSALQKAVKVLLGSSTTRQTTATESDVRVKEEDVQARVRKERAAAQRAKNADTAAKQPAATTNVGSDHDKAGGKITADKVMRMSQDEFRKLSEADLRELRGDEA